MLPCNSGVCTQGLDDYLYGRGVYGKGFSSTDPVAFEIHKASEASCLDSVHFRICCSLAPPVDTFLKVVCVY